MISDGDNWSYKTCKARQYVSTNKSTPRSLQAGCTSCHPTNSVQAPTPQGQLGTLPPYILTQELGQNVMFAPVPGVSLQSYNCCGWQFKVALLVLLRTSVAEFTYSSAATVAATLVMMVVHLASGCSAHPVCPATFQRPTLVFEVKVQ